MTRASASLVAFLGLLAAGTTAARQAPEAVSFPTPDGGTIHADLYGKGTHAVLLAHGRIFDKESWAPLARRLEADGYQVLAIDFRGYGDSSGGTGGLEQDVLGGIRYLREEQQATAVSVIGGSMGSGAAAQAAVLAAPGQIDALVLLSGGWVETPEQLHAARILYIASEAEPMTPGIREQYERAPQPRKLVLLPGDAHAQHIFKTDQAERLTEEILDFLAAH